ncbi:hypothetical protein ABW20_dc0105452 [Dactylellina cionopaga]|nr:hypothetical protein ABW20_dc0105452 [Dactylellina cionopaga]
MKRLHAEMPRPDEKLMFFPPGVLETITNSNPDLEDIFLPFLSVQDITQLASSYCTRTLRSLEIQSSICRTITRDTSFDVSNLVQLFTSTGLPNLEVLRWAIGGRLEMAVGRELISALYPADPQVARRHNLQLLAVESRLPTPQSPYVMAGILNWEELLHHRVALLKACYGGVEGSEGTNTQGNSLSELIKSVRLTVDGVDQSKVELDMEFSYMNPRAVKINHLELSDREAEYLKKWRKSGGSIGITVDGPNEGLIYDFRKSVFEELYFFDLRRMRAFAIGNKFEA